MKLSVKKYVLFYIPLRHPFFVKTSVVFTGKNYVLFYREKLRTFLHGKTTYFFTTDFFTKNYGLFY